MSSLLAVIRIRGSVKANKEVNDTLFMLRLNRRNHCVLIPDTSQYTGMLKRVQSWVTWGKINQKTLAKLIEGRGRLSGNRPLDQKALKKLDFDSFEKMADALAKGKKSIKDLDDFSPVFRLNPPRKGFKATRLPYPRGDLGYRKEAINELLERMI